MYIMYGTLVEVLSYCCVYCTHAPRHRGLEYRITFVRS